MDETYEMIHPVLSINLKDFSVGNHITNMHMFHLAVIMDIDNNDFQTWKKWQAGTV